MAVVKGHFSFQIQDYNPTTRSVAVPFSTSTGLLADMELALAALAPLLDAVVGGVIAKSQIVIPATLPGGLKSTAVAGINNSLCGLIDWINASNTDKYGVVYPGWYTANAGNGFLPASPSLVNQSDAAVAAFIAAIEAVANNTTYVTEDLFPITGLSRAIKSNRSTRKQLARAK
jgi:hypothetical protein